MKVGSRSSEPAEVVIDGRSLSVGNGCELRGLSGHVRVRSELESGKLCYLQVVDSPALLSLDLTACPAGFDLEVDGSSHCDDVRLPREGVGVTVLLTIPRDFPATRFHGWIEEIQIQCAGNHPVAGFYRIEHCDGVALLSDGNVERHGDIQCYVRIDQSERGLQYKRLRPRVAPDEIFWQLLDCRAAPDDDALGYIMGMQPPEFTSLVLGTASDVERQRRKLLEGIRFPRAMCDQLVRLWRRGFSPRALWAWRCMLQRASAGDDFPERIGRALLRARPGWPGRPFVRHLNTPLSVPDLRLLMLCRPDGLTARCERRLLEHGEPSGLQVIIELAASLPPRHPWWEPVSYMIRASMNRWRRLVKLEWDQVDRESFPAWNRLTGSRTAPELLMGAMRNADRIPDRHLQELILEFACENLAPNTRIRTGVQLCEEGSVSGRQLITSGLQESVACSARLHARAMRGLLSSG